MARLGREDEAVPLLEEAQRLFREQSDTRGEADALHTLAACRARRGEPGAGADFAGAIELYRRAAAGGMEPLDGQDLKARVGLAVIDARAGRYDEAAATLEGVLMTARERGASVFRRSPSRSSR